MNILITGITGFVGAHLADYLSKQSNTIYGLYRSKRYESTLEALGLSRHKNINLILGNIGSYPEMEEIVIDNDIDQVYHLAAQAIVKSASMSPISTYQTNILGTINLLESIRLGSDRLKKDIPTLVMSSDKAYGTSLILPYKEEFPLNGLDIYSSSKACEDIIARAYAYNYNLPIVVIRSCNIFGEYDFNWSRIIPQFIKAYLDSKKITIYKNTSGQLREYIYIKDLIRALTLLISSDNISKTKGRAFNITSKELYSVDQILDIFKTITNFVNIEYIEKDKGFKEIESQYLDCTKLEDTIGWKKEYNFIDAFKITIDCYNNWYKKYVS